MQGALDLGSRVKRVGGGYSDVPYDAEELLLLGAEEVLLLREALESARREAQWARRELDEERSQHSLTVRASIRRDRSLLSDDGLGVWLDALLETGDTSGDGRQLSLRWAQGLTDSGLGQLRARGEWASTLVALDSGT